MEERLSQLEQMARKVVRSNTGEGRLVNERKLEINNLWDKLKVGVVYSIVIKPGLCIGHPLYNSKLVSLTFFFE